MTVLAPMTQAEFDAFAEESIAAYAHDNVISGRVSQADGSRVARQSFSQLLPRGLATPKHQFFTIRESAAGAAVGALWFADVDTPEGRTGFIYNIRIQPAYRGRGHAKQALDLIEPVARQLGLDAIALHVFGFNTTAQALYRSLAYGITGMNMRKVLRQD